jgi:choline dehydrogenase-like flavoprotein
MLVTYVPEAERLGARLYANARAELVEADPGRPRRRVRRVRGRAAGPDGRPGAPFTVEAKVVVLAAGAVASPDLLLRSGLANGSGQVGENLHLHPSVMAAGFFDEPIHAYRGIPQSYYVDEFIDLERDPRSGTILMPIAGFPVLTAANLPGFGRDHFRFMQRFAHTAGLLALLHDQSAGSVRPGASQARPQIAYALGEGDRRQLAEGLLHCAEVLFAGGANEVLVPYAADPLRLRPGDDLSPILARGVAQAGPNAIPLASTHPQSTCRMSGDPQRGVVGEYGECHEVAGLFVADMSVFPTSLGAPPQITTAALADRTARHVLERWNELGA